MFDSDNDSDYYGAIKLNDKFNFSEFADFHLMNAVETFNEQIEFNKKKEKKAVEQYHSISSRKGKGQEERLEEKRFLLEDIQFYKQKQRIIKNGLDKVEKELKKRQTEKPAHSVPNKTSMTGNTESVIKELEAEKQLLSRFMPPEQLFTTLDLLEGEEGSFFAGKIKEIATAIESAPKIYETDGMKEHPVVLRYFHPTGTETLVCEIGADGEAFGYQVINGDWNASEFGYLNIDEIKNIPGMEIDYHFPENMSIERWLYTQSPEHFREYAELDTISKYREKHPFDKNVYSKKLSSHLEKTCEQIDEYISSGKLPEDSRFILPSTPEYLLKTGAKNTNITIAASVIKKAVNVHGLSSQQIKNAIYKLYDPVIVFESDRTKSENKAESRLILTDEWKDGKPFAIAVNVNSDVQFRKDDHRVFLEVQDIRSIHDRELIAKNGTDLIQKWTKDGLCHYVDDKKISDWSTGNKVYFPIEVLQSDGNNIIQKSNLINQTIQKSLFI